MKRILLVVVFLACAAAFAERQPFQRYQSIVDRQMFGVPPPGFDPTKPPSEVTKEAERELTQEQEKLQSSVHFSVINVTPDGETVVGFTDNADPKVPVQYYLKVGETRNGWHVKEADPATATMTIVKNDIEVSLKIGDNSAKGGGKTSAATHGGGRPGPATRGSPLGGSLRARRMQREAAAKKAEEARVAKEAEAEARREEAAQRQEAERAERDAAMAEQRKQLQAIQEELKKQREAEAAKAREKAEESHEGDDAS